MGGYTMESLKLSEPNEDSVEERSEGEESGIDARLSVTQSDDPLSGGHLVVGMSKPPLRGHKVRTEVGGRIVKKLTPGPPEKVVES